MLFTPPVVLGPPRRLLCLIFALLSLVGCDFTDDSTQNDMVDVPAVLPAPDTLPEGVTITDSKPILLRLVVAEDKSVSVRDEKDLTVGELQLASDFVVQHGGCLGYTMIHGQKAIPIIRLELPPFEGVLTPAPNHSNQLLQEEAMQEWHRDQETYQIEWEAWKQTNLNKAEDWLLLVEQQLAAPRIHKQSPVVQTITRANAMLTEPVPSGDKMLNAMIIVSDNCDDVLGQTDTAVFMDDVLYVFVNPAEACSSGRLISTPESVHFENFRAALTWVLSKAKNQ